MASSALESVLDYLQETLSNADSLKGVTVYWGPPVGDDTPAEFVSVGFGPKGESGDSNREWGPLGGGKLDESFSVELMVSASRSNATDLRPAYRRSFEIATAVETAIRADLTLGDLLLQPARLESWRGEHFRADRVRGHRIYQTLTGSARI